MALSESGLKGGMGPMIISGPGGRKVTVRPKSSRPGAGGKRNYYAKPKASKGRRR